MSEFVNPYTFIPLKKRTTFAPAHENELLTGVIRCRLTTKTPLIIPDGQIVTGDPEAENPFFRIGGKPAIPGSSLRGPIRSMYEALTDSCMRTNDDVLSSAGGKKLPGLLRWDAQREEYVLYTAKRYRVVNKRLRNNPSIHAPWVTGDEVYITTGPEKRNSRFMVSSGVVESVSERPTKDAIPGFYIRVNQMSGKTANSPSVFVEDQQIEQRVPECSIKSLGESIRIFVNNSAENEGQDASIAQNYKHIYDNLKQGAVLPVWYAYEKLVDGTYAFHFAWSELSRNVYPKSAKDFVRELGLQSCSKDRGPLCPACELFGYTGQEAGHTLDNKAGKVRFGDALPVEEVSTQRVFLSPLMEPKTHATEFYLRNDRYRQSFTPMTEGTELSGRKVYWHHQDGVHKGNLAEWSGERKDFLAYVEAVSPGAVFNFEVFFDRVSKQELNELVYVLTLGEYWQDGEPAHCHKIGHAKPLGAGSVLIEVDQVTLRKAEGGIYRVTPWGAEERLSSVGKGGQAGTVEQRLSHLDAVMRVTAFDAIDAGVDIDYPRKVTDGDIFAWFTGNHDQSSNKSSETIVGYRKVLPKAVDPSQTLPRAINRYRSTLLDVDPPAVIKLNTGIITEVKQGTSGLHGWIKPDGGGRTVFYHTGENQHVKDLGAFVKGAKISYQIKVVPDKKGKPSDHAVDISFL